MTQRTKVCTNNVNFETIACERYMSRLLQRELKEKPKTPSSGNQKSRYTKAVVSNQSNKVVKPEPKQSYPPVKPHIPGRNVVEFGDDSALVEVTVKTTNPRQRSRSTTVDREPWGQLLHRQKSSDKMSIFGKFDPLRTLHFLAKELQFQLQAVLPEDNAVQQMLADIQDALKRVPPEVASTVHLQSALELIPNKRRSKSNIRDVPENLKYAVSDQSTQTTEPYKIEDSEKFRKLMEDSTLKLEESFKHMEIVCTKLKTEKESLEKQLHVDRETLAFYRKRIEDLEAEHTCVLHPKIDVLEKEKQKLESDLLALKYNYETQNTITSSDMKQQIADLNHSKTLLEQECSKLKHQIRLSTIEREKYVAVLAVRDRQINEIRKEMSQLQDVVNDQLLELHNNVFKSVPSSPNISENVLNMHADSKENVFVDATISTIYSNEDQVQKYFSPKENISFRDLGTSDNEASEMYSNQQEHHNLEKKTHRENKVQESGPCLNKLDKMDSQASIRSMFNEIKKTAYAVTSSSHGSRHVNLINK